ncbi:cell division FtsA domain-containing protein [Evansella sp. AB-P1]|uniref:cell division protein FtsA n=1 Tax=Evansella sp. AB-P1 TaxID=3037653 RepID=UPI00241FB23D|nr:cell division FtsA domain-containing protein [Evansella sp. AB-P1]MDG5787032.1 cell division FtsA domain-containing protein [Evansella sp. AB-P1]
MKEEIVNPIFALDIGTRSVVGLILHKRSNGYHVIDIIRKEHDERSMLDGQIHNVLAVSKVINSIKEKLEEKHGPLKTVCVAAAGRSLKTEKATFEIDIKGKPIFNRQDILHLELNAVQKAQFSLAKQYNEVKKSNDYCVGYSVINYCLDDQVIGSLVDQRGEKATVEIIATFLPKVVVESLIAALHRSNLELEALTLEPIAAIHVLIPHSMRRLNIALVDIGAGTSDIAITNLGTVTAYGMVPVAGDEITEAISDHFLLDFPDAEKLKRDITTNEKVKITDVLGFETEYSKVEVVEPIFPAVEKLAKKICQEIIMLNQQAPKAVMLVGGGSLTPKLPEVIAQYLELPANRVAIRGIDALKGITFDTALESTPELVTPIGIAIAAKESPVEYISITVNDQTVRLFDIKKLTVTDGIITSGIELKKYYGKPGMAMMVNVNGRVVSVPGEHGTPPQLEKNGNEVNLDDPLQHGDKITIAKGVDGKDSSATIGDFFDEPPSLQIVFNGENKIIDPIIVQNDLPATLKSKVKDRDKINVYVPNTISDILSQVDDCFNKEKVTKIKKVYLNNKEHEIKSSFQLLLNNEAASIHTIISPGDELTYKLEKESSTLSDLLERNEIEFIKDIVVTFNDQSIRLEKQIVDIYRNNEKLPPTSILEDGDELRIVQKEDTPFIFQDIFSKVSIEQPTGKIKKPVILQNEQPATFSSIIRHGDDLELKWV